MPPSVPANYSSVGRRAKGRGRAAKRTTGVSWSDQRSYSRHAVASALSPQLVQPAPAPQGVVRRRQTPCQTELDALRATCGGSSAGGGLSKATRPAAAVAIPVAWHIRHAWMDPTRGP